jgi:hypothetical protein
VISGVVNTSDKFITGVIDTGEQLSPVTMTPAINLCKLGKAQVNCHSHHFPASSKNDGTSVGRNLHRTKPGV